MSQSDGQRRERHCEALLLVCVFGGGGVLQEVHRESLKEFDSRRQGSLLHHAITPRRRLGFHGNKSGNH